MFQVGDRKRTRRSLELSEKPSSRRRLSVQSIAENGPLRGAVVCLTGLPADEKDRMHRYVEQLGGSYTRDLDTAKTTHLIAQEPEGAKYDTAIACPTIRVVTPTWLEECVNNGTRVDEKLHSLMANTTGDSYPPLEQELEQQLRCDIRNDLLISCRFLLLGFDGESDVNNKLSRLIRRGKGTIYWELNEMITHVIVADDCDESIRDDARTISLHHPHGSVAVSPFWVLSSWKNTTLASESSFPPRKTAAKEVSKKIQKTASKNNRQPSSLFRGIAFALLRSSPPSSAVDFDAKELEACITLHGGLMLSSELLDALRVDKASKENQLRTCYVVCWGGYTPAHMMVHPLLSRVEKEKLCVVVPVTPIWLYACSADRKLIKPDKHPILFEPQPWSMYKLPDSKKNKKDTIKISITGFVGSQRSGIIQALRILGAQYTENLSSTNTHLICKDNTGAKYEKAIKWGLFVVSIEWLYHIMEHGYGGKDAGDDNVGCEDRFSLVSHTPNESVASADSRDKSCKHITEYETAPELSQNSS